MERLNKLSLGIRGQTLGEDKNCPPVASPTTTDHKAPMMDVLQTLFDAPQQTLVHLSPVIGWEQNPSLSESVSWDLPPGGPLCTMLPISAEVICPDAVPFRCQARLCSRFLPDLPSSQQPTSQAA